MDIRKAQRGELEMVCRLYKAAVGGRFCVWNEFYPGMEEAAADFEDGGLYVLIDGGKIIGAASLSAENELSSLSCWTTQDGTERELARVVTDEAHRGKGLASRLVSSLLALLEEQGCRAARLSVATVNVPALKMYRRLGFAEVGEGHMYGGQYVLMEKVLGRGAGGENR